MVQSLRVLRTLHAHRYLMLLLSLAVTTKQKQLFAQSSLESHRKHA
jgi:hypothetical protein